MSSETHQTHKIQPFSLSIYSFIIIDFCCHHESPMRSLVFLVAFAVPMWVLWTCVSK